MCVEANGYVYIGCEYGHIEYNECTELFYDHIALMSTYAKGRGMICETC